MPSMSHVGHSKKGPNGGKLLVLLFVLFFLSFLENYQGNKACCITIFNKMQIIIQSTGNIIEYSMIEFQGDLETKSEEALGNKIIGDLHFNHEGNPIMIIGHHILHGKVQELEKPLVVITKENDDPVLENNVRYGVTAVINKKLIFKTRPKPIVGEMIKKL